MHLYEMFLIEYQRSITANKFGIQLVNASKEDSGYTKYLQNAGIRGVSARVDDMLGRLENMDPTRNKKYVLWLIHQYLSKKFKFEDSERVLDVLTQYVRFKPQFKRLNKNPDLNQYDLHSLESLMDELTNVSTETGTEEPTTDVKILYNGPYGTLSVPLTYKASCQLGSGTKWCTAAGKNRSHYDYYSSQGPLYVWRDRDGSKYQFHFESFQFMDSADRSIPHIKLKMFRTQHPVLSKLFHKAEIEQILIDADKAYKYSHDVIGGPWKEAENLFVDTACFSFLYAKNILKDRFPEGEKAIATDPHYAYLYAKDVIKDRFPEGENAIASDPHYAYLYATDVIKGRFPEGENSIKQIHTYATLYAKYALKSDWPEANVFNIEFTPYPDIGELQTLRTVEELDAAYEKFINANNFDSMSADELYDSLLFLDSTSEIENQKEWLEIFISMYDRVA